MPTLCGCVLAARAAVYVHAAAIRRSAICGVGKACLEAARTAGSHDHRVADNDRDRTAYTCAAEIRQAGLGHSCGHFGEDPASHAASGLVVDDERLPRDVCGAVGHIEVEGCTSCIAGGGIANGTPGI